MIMITGHGDIDLAIKSLKLEATDFITKPINDDALEIALKRATEKIEMRTQIQAHNENLYRLVQNELKVARHRYHQLFNAAPCYISVQDKTFRIVESNHLFQKDFGNQKGAFCYEIYKHRHESCPKCPVAATFSDGQSHEQEMVVTSRSGDQYNVLIQTAPLLNEKGEIHLVMELSTNITQIRKLQDHLSSLGMLIGSISHGIKGLLTGLDGGMYLLESGFTKANRNQIKEGWNVVKLMVDRIRRMVLDILYYAKERELEWERVSVLHFARDVALIIKPKCKDHRIEFKLDFDETLGNFDIDPGVVSSALVNILENAVDACIEDKAKSSHTVMFIAKQTKTDIIFEITDNGIGMEKETLENMFSLFFSSKGGKGTGLGLFISNRIVNQHGGSIVVDSEKGKGTRFIVKMPKSPADKQDNGK